jgi:hypothetical protein
MSHHRRHLNGAGVAFNVPVRYPERVAGLVLSRPDWLDGPMFIPVADRGFCPSFGRPIFLPILGPMQIYSSEARRGRRGKGTPVSCREVDLFGGLAREGPVAEGHD